MSGRGRCGCLSRITRYKIPRNKLEKGGICLRLFVGCHYFIKSIKSIDKYKINLDNLAVIVLN